MKPKEIENKDDGEKIIFVAGGFDPIHIGHIDQLRQAKELGGYLIVSVARDEHLVNKKGYVFMSEWERVQVVKAIRYVDEVIYHLGDDGTVIENIRVLKQRADNEGKKLIFAKGGDRNKFEIPEGIVCNELGVDIVDGLGAKVQSSSYLISELIRKIQLGVHIKPVTFDEEMREAQLRMLKDIYGNYGITKDGYELSKMMDRLGEINRASLEDMGRKREERKKGV